MQDCRGYRRFLFPSTTNKTFAYAGEIIHYQFSRTELYNEMYDIKAKYRETEWLYSAKL